MPRSACRRRTFLSVSGALVGLGMTGCRGSDPGPGQDASLPSCLRGMATVAEASPGQANQPREAEPQPNHLVVSTESEPRVASVVPLADRGGVLRVWSAASGELRHSYRIDAPATLRWQAGRPVVLWPDFQDVVLLNVDTGVLGRLRTEHAQVDNPNGPQAAFSAVATADLLATIGYDNTVRVHSLNSCGEQRRFNVGESVLQVDLRTDGTVLVLHKSGLSMAGPKDSQLTLVAHPQGPNAFVQTAKVAVAVSNWSARVFNDWEPGARLEWNVAEPLVGGAIRADGALFAGCLPQTHRLGGFQTADGERREIKLPSASRQAVFDPDGGLYTIHLREGVIAWDAETGTESRRFELPAR